jgi:hypothetical protein
MATGAIKRLFYSPFQTIRQIDKSDQEVLVFPSRFAMMEMQPNHFVASAKPSVP